MDFDFERYIADFNGNDAESMVAKHYTARRETHEGCRISCPIYRTLKPLQCFKQ
jgi:hypothetical protein